VSVGIRCHHGFGEMEGMTDGVDGLGCDVVGFDCCVSGPGVVVCPPLPGTTSGQGRGS
jgi:hypothetical protein